MLERDQTAIAATLLHGPAHLPAGLFAGDEAAVVRGLRVHANTISHARLVALEDSFPRTREYLGEARFSTLSRAFLDAGGAARRPLSELGADFPECFDDPRAADLARVEWAWLQSYHAAEALALGLGDLAGLGETGLLDMPVRRHPAARVVRLETDAAPLVDPAFVPETAAILVTRPDAEVRLFPIVPADAAAIDLARENVALGNLIALLAEQHPDGGSAIVALIGAGAFERV